jgi:hypothetical protein
VRGRPNALQIAGQDGGTKLLEIRRLAAQGHSVKVIGERQFWKLVATTTTKAKQERNKKATRAKSAAAPKRRVRV